MIFIFVTFTNICYATPVAVTRENLNEALQEFVSSDDNEENYEISVLKDVINVTVDNETYAVNYDLTDKPTFSIEVPIETGMSYDDFNTQTDNLNLPILGYIAIANIQGEEFEDSMTYFLLTYAESALNGSYSSENSYWIVDDLAPSDGVTIVKKDDPKTIYTSEFGDRVMEYVNALYPETQTISDSKDANSYVMTIEKQEVTETSCKLVATLTVNLDADFSKIEELADSLKESFINSGITKENADYVVELKVGQKCKIESSEQLGGYELQGDFIEFDREQGEITATKAGDAKLGIYIKGTKKTFYITVKENTGNETLETITLKIDKLDDKNDDSNIIVNINKLPETGEQNSTILFSLYTLVGICSLSVIITLYISRKKK